MTTITELKKLLFSMILKTPIWLVHLAANQELSDSVCRDTKLARFGLSRDMLNDRIGIS